MQYSHNRILSSVKNMVYLGIACGGGCELACYVLSDLGLLGSLGGDVLDGDEELDG